MARKEDRMSWFVEWSKTENEGSSSMYGLRGLWLVRTQEEVFEAVGLIQFELRSSCEAEVKV